MDERPIYTLILRPEPHVEEPTRELRHILKVLLRRFGFRAVSVSENSDAKASD